MSNDPYSAYDDRQSTGALKLVFVGIAVCVVAFILYIKLQRPSAAVAQGVKLELLDLEPLTAESGPIQHKDLLGKVTLLNFWGTWCPPCVIEFPHILALHERFKDQADFQLISVSSPGFPDVTADALRAETAQFLAERNAMLPTYHNPRHKPFIEAYPTTILADRQGIARAVWQGYEPGMEEQIQEAIERELVRKN